MAIAMKAPNPISHQKAAVPADEDDDDAGLAPTPMVPLLDPLLDLVYEQLLGRKPE